MSNEAAARSIDVLAEHGYGGFALFLRALVNTTTAKAPQDRITLTRAELAIARLLAAGETPKEIATHTKRSVLTIRTHIKNIAVKLGCSGRSESIAEARNRGWLK